MNKKENSHKNWWQAQDGAVLPLIGLAFAVLVLAAGFTIDYTRAQIVRERMQWALDAGALAGAKVAGRGMAAVNAEANAYFRANFPPGYMGTQGGTVVASSVAPINGKGYGLRFRVQGMQMRNYVMDVFGGMQTIGVNAMAEVNTVAPKFADVVFALDVSGSMDATAGFNCVYLPYAANCYSAGSKLAAAKTAMESLVNQVGGNGARFGLVPFSHAVNLYGAVNGATSLGTCNKRAESPVNPVALVASESHSAIGTGNARVNYEYNIGTNQPIHPYWDKLYPCYYFYDDVYQTSTSVVGYHDPGGHIRRAGSLHPVQYLTSNTTQITNAIRRQQPHGNTDGSLGMYWAYRMLIPGSVPWVNASTTTGQKAIILLSDGHNTMHYKEPGKLVSTADATQRTWCQTARNAGIDVYTIAYDMIGSAHPRFADARQLLIDCASSKCGTGGNQKCYFYAENNAALLDAFKTIGESLMTMRLTR